MHAHSSSLARDEASLVSASPTQVVSEVERNPEKVGPCIDRARVCWGVGRNFTQLQCFKFTHSHYSVNAKKGCEKSSVALPIDARIQSSNFHLAFC